jgi:thiol:disulfide interchange protein DsbD
MNIFNAKSSNLLFFAALCLAALISFTLEAQIVTPVKWKSQHTANQKTKVGDAVELTFSAEIEKGWYLYSSDFSPELGPLVTTFPFNKNDTYELIGKITPVNPKKKYDEMWGGEYTYFTKNAEFKQKIKILKPKVKINVSVSCQACTEEDGRCVPIEEDFTFEFSALSSGEKATETPAKNETPTENPATGDSLSQNNTVSIDSQAIKSEEVLTEKQDSLAEKNREKKLLGKLVGDENLSLLGFMLVAFLSGLAALLTPCVFPMIPMTVSFFSSRSGSRAQAVFQAVFYGFSIIAIYTLIGVFVSYFFGDEAANFIATNWAVNVVFFLVFVIFAISFFGAFEIVLPNNFVNSIDRKADKGGYAGVFFMALTLVVVSFSCTGPIAGTILIESAQGNFLRPAFGMFAFSSAFALPFMMFAIFPSWLSKLPSSGSWLNTVKVVLGFIELALAFKFLSVADQVQHWGILDRDVYLTIWIATALALTFYLLGWFRLPHDSVLERVGVGRFMTALTAFTFALYLIPGLVGAPLKALSGYLPPLSSHNFDLVQMLDDRKTKVRKKPKYSEFLHLPHGIKGYFEYKEALAAAREQKKPLFIDFTGHGCVNCREMEAYVWSNPEALDLLKEKFVVVALYVDDPTELPENEWVKSTFDGKMKKTIGKVNSDIQKTRFNNNAQPFYVILDNEGRLLTAPTVYNRDANVFIQFLEEGLATFNKGI